MEGMIMLRWLRYERLLIALGGITVLALAVRAGWSSRVTWEALLCTLFFAAATLALGSAGSWRRKIRVVFAYAFVFWYYSAVARFVPALGLETQDATLRALDEWLFGLLPAVGARHVASYWLTELFSVSYLMYLVYLHMAFLHVLTQPAEVAQCFASRVCGTFAFGLPGYLLMPAVGPLSAFPALFPGPLLGGPLSRCNSAIVTWGSSVYDAFPSLHVLVTASLLLFDWQHCRRRFWWMLGPALAITLSTVYLGYHYVIDLIAAIVWFVAVSVLLAYWNDCHVESQPARNEAN